MRDHATAYAKAVDTGTIPAGSYVRDACRRHLDDLDAGIHEWRPEIMESFCDLITELEVLTDDGYKPMELLPWQHFFIGSLLGWIVVDPKDPLKRQVGTRRYRHATLETAKGSGKSTLLTAMAAWMLTFDGWEDDTGTWRREEAAQCYCIASIVRQAQDVALIPMERATLHSELFEEMGRKVLGGRRPERIEVAETGSYFAATSTAPRGKAGRRIHYILAEELQEWSNREALDALIANFKARKQPLVVSAFNAGAFRAGVAWEERHAGVMASRGQGADNHFGFVAECSDNFKPARLPDGRKAWWPHRDEWEHANPSIGTHLVPDQYILGAIEKAEHPHQQDEVLRLNFGIWPGAQSDLLDWRYWKECEVEEEDWEDPEPGPGVKLFISIDLGKTRDMTAMGLLWSLPDDGLLTRVEYWIPEALLAKRAEQSTEHLLRWAKDGLLNLVPGRVMDYGLVAVRIDELVQKYEAVEVTIDPYYADSLVHAANTRDIALHLDTEEVPPYKGSVELLVHAQRYRPGKNKLWMETSIEAFVTNVATGRIGIKINPVLRWNFNNVKTMRNEAGTRKLAKAHHRRPGDSIDGITALVQGCGLEERSRRLEPKLDRRYEDDEYSFYRDYFDDA